MTQLIHWIGYLVNWNRYLGKLRQTLVGALLLLAWQNSSALVVLQYHHISEDTPAATSISPARFSQHMTWLADNQYRILSMEEFLVLLKKNETLPDKAVVITFDDGYTSLYSEAWPVLKKRGWPFTVFVNSQHHDEKNAQYMSWAQLREMAEAGVTIGNHSVSHSHMIRLQQGEKQADWRKRMKQEIAVAQKRIDKEVGRQAKIFAYPFGEHNQALENLLAELKYVAFAQHSGPIAEFDSLQALPRFPFGGIYGDINDFALKAASLPMPLKEVTLVAQKNQSLVDPLLPNDAEKITLLISGENAFLKRISCFYSGKPVTADIRGDQLYVSADVDIPVGRSRFNCTAPEKGRFYWLSKMLIRKNADGSWYKE